MLSITRSGVKKLIPKVLNASGNAPLYGSRAWVNFNGTGIVAIGSSGNVSSIIDNANGSYTINFSIPMQDAFYSANISHIPDCTANATSNHRQSEIASQDASNISVYTFARSEVSGGPTKVDFPLINVSVMR